jgi:hypothetical protein
VLAQHAARTAVQWRSRPIAEIACAGDVSSCFLQNTLKAVRSCARKTTNSKSRVARQPLAPTLSLKSIGFGTSRWQLDAQATSIAERDGRVMTACGPNPEVFEIGADFRL